MQGKPRCSQRAERRRVLLECSESEKESVSQEVIEGYSGTDYRAKSKMVVVRAWGEGKIERY